MRALLIKDWRLTFPITITMIAIYAILPILLFFTRAADEGLRAALARDEVIACLGISAIAGLFISLLIVPAAAGVAFARERRDRSSEFLASCPVPRSRVVASKCIVAIFVTALPWALSFALAVIAAFLDYANGETVGSLISHQFEIDRSQILWMLRVEIMLAGTAWLFSSMFRSEVLAAALSILLAILLTISYAAYRSKLERIGMFVNNEAELKANLLAAIVTQSLGLGGFLAGIVIALRRVSP